MQSEKKIIAALIAAYALAAGSAQAATWDGFYLGATAGVAETEADFQTGPIATGTYFATTSVPSINASGNGKAKDRGFTGGLTLGYNIQNGGLVYGTEADVDYLRTKSSRSATATYPCCAPSTYTLNQYAKLDGLATVRGRFGGAFGNSLIYGTAGLAYTSIKTGYEFTDNFGLNARSSATQTKPKWGWAAGVGYEHALPGKVTVKAEYLYANFGDVSMTAPMTATGSSAQFTHTVKVHTSIVRLGVNKLF